MTVEVFAALACLSKWRCAYDTSAPRNSRPSTASFMNPFPLRREPQPNGHAMAGRPTTYDGGDGSDCRDRRRYRHKPPQSPKAVTTLPLDTKKGMLRQVARAVGLRLPQALGPRSPGEKETARPTRLPVSWTRPNKNPDDSFNHRGKVDTANCRQTARSEGVSRQSSRRQLVVEQENNVAARFTEMTIAQVIMTNRSLSELATSLHRRPIPAD